MFLIAEQTSWLADNGITTTDDSSRYELDIKLPSTIEANEKQQQRGGNVTILEKEQKLPKNMDNIINITNDNDNNNVNKNKDNNNQEDHPVNNNTTNEDRMSHVLTNMKLLLARMKYGGQEFVNTISSAESLVV